MSNIFSDKRKLFGTILGLIMFALTVVSITYAYYSWRSGNTIVTFNIQDNVFYCEHKDPNNTGGIAPVLDYKTGFFDSYIVKNIGRSDTTFSITIDILSCLNNSNNGTSTNCSEFFRDDFKYKVLLDPTGGSNNCSVDDTNCTVVGEGNFSGMKVGKNTLIRTVNLPNNSKYQYYVFLYLDGNVSNPNVNTISGHVMSAALGICDIYDSFDLSYIKLSSSAYQIGGNCASVSPDCIKLTNGSTYGAATTCSAPYTAVGLPTPTRSDTVISFNSNASGVSNPSNKTVKYDFSGWYNNNNFTGNAITNSTVVTTTTNEPLFAKWTPNTPSSGSITLPTISRPGYTFDGWYTAASGGTRVGGIGDSYLPTDCTKTLYAHWTAISKTINIRKDNAAWSNSGVTIGLSTSDSVYITDGNGKTVIDQEVASAATVTFVSDDSVENGIIAAGTPYYVWVGKDSNHKSDMVYTGITFNGNDNTSPIANYYTLILRSNHVSSMRVNGTGVNDAGSVIVASNWPHNITSAADTGYSFASWSKTAGGGTVTFGDASQANTTANVTVNSATITASANINSYTITLKAGKGVSTLTADGWTNSPAATITKSYNYNSTINLADIVTPNFKTGYSGVSYTKTSGSGTLSGSSFTVGAGVTTITINATALAAPTCTTITGGTTKIYNYQDTILTATNSTSYDSGVNLTYRFGYAADNETAFASYADSNVSGHPNQYSVTKALYRGTKHYGVKITATGDGGLTNSCTMSPGSGTAMTLKNKKITFNATQNGGTLSGTGTLYIAYDNASVYTTATEATAGTIPTATKGGYTFDGWFTANGIKVINANGTLVTSATDNGTVWTSGGKWANTSVADATLYAQFVTNSYTVSYASTAACPLPSGSSSTGYDSATVHFGDVINKANPTCTGYNFDGWTLTGGDTSTAKYGTTNNPTTNWVNKNKGTYFKNLASVSGATPTMTANWVAQQYTLTFNGNGATTNGTGSVQVTYGSSTLSPSTITLPQKSYTVSYNMGSTGIAQPSSDYFNYGLAGWTTIQNGSTLLLNNSTSPSLVANIPEYTGANGVWSRASGATVYAKWTNGSITLPALSLTGYKCTWHRGSTTGTEYNPGVQVTDISANTTFYAVCEAYNYKNLDTNTYYMKLSEAFDGVSNNQTIQVLNSVTETTSPTIASTKTGVKLDMNGKITTFSSSVYLVNNGGLDIYSSIDGGVLQGSANRIIYNNGTLTTNGTSSSHTLTIQNTSSSVYYVIYNNTGKEMSLNTNTTVKYTSSTSSYRYLVYDAGILNINGAVLENYVSSLADYDRGIIIGNAAGRVIMTSGTIYTGGYGVYNSSGTGNGDSAAVVISGGTITSTNGFGIYNYVAGMVKISGGTITSTDSFAIYNNTGEVRISGGTLSGNVGIHNNSGTINVGGSATITGNSNYGIDNYDSSGVINVSGGSVTGKTGIHINSGNISISGTSTTVTGTSGDGIYGETGTVTMSNGTVTGSTTGIYISSGSATITGGTVIGTSQNGIRVYSSSGSLTLGTNDGGTPSTTIPEIRSNATSGAYYGVYMYDSGGTFNFYDGKVVGYTSHSTNRDNSDINTPNGYTVVKDTVDGRETATLTRILSTTIHYNSNATSGSFTAATETLSCVAGSATTCTVTIPSTVTSSNGKYNSTYAGLAYAAGSMTTNVGIGATTITLGASSPSDYYAKYTSPITVNWYDSTVSEVIEGSTFYECSSGTKLYRNEFFISPTSIATITSTSATSTAQATTLSLTGITGTFAGLATARTTNTVYAVNNATIINSNVTTYYAVATDNQTITFHYNSNAVLGEFTHATTTNTRTRYYRCNAQTISGTSYAVRAINYANYTIPAVVSSSVGKYNSSYRGVTSSPDNPHVIIGSSSTGAYAIYSQPLTIYYPNTTGGVSSSSTSLYRNEYFTASGGLTMRAVTSTSRSRLTQVTNSDVSLPNLRGTLLGITPNANTSTGYMAVNNSGVIGSGDTTYYAVTSDPGANATIYYNSNTTEGGFTPSTATVTGTSTYYCVDSSTQASEGETIAVNATNVPSVVRESVGKWNTPYHGISSSVNSMNLASSMTTGGSYYAVYGAGETTGGTGAIDSNVDGYHSFSKIGSSSSHTVNQTFSYTGNIQTYNIPYTGVYKLETWGAQGGNADSYSGGKGGYSTGLVRLTAGTTLYIVVGGKGANISGSGNNSGGYNGGGNATLSSGNIAYGAAGGGATHIATATGVLSTLSNNKASVLIVAGGGGGANHRGGGYGEGAGGVGGGASGGDGFSTNHTNGYGYAIGTGGTQSSGGYFFGYAGTGISGGKDLNKKGTFGAGYPEQSGGGGGWYGGGGSGHGGAGGGSGFVGGVTAGVNISGDSLMPTHDGSSTMIGNSNNGYAKISYYVDDFDNSEYIYSYTGNYQKFIAPSTGTYKIELWGAQGGGSAGKGGYTSGNIVLNEGAELYIYVGEKGLSYPTQTNFGGWNGGGYSGDNSSSNSYGGGGATDVRLEPANLNQSDTWYGADSFRSRIMVAGGGGGGFSITSFTQTAGVGGGLTGGIGIGSYANPDVSSGGGTQTGAGTAYSSCKSGSFGYGSQTNCVGFGGGGGGGYWGGSTGNGKPGGGGSSYISGYKGSVAVTSASNSSPKGGCDNGTTDITCSYHYSGNIFTDTVMIDGAHYMPTHDGTGIMLGNNDNGYAKITRVGVTSDLYRNEYFTSATGMNTVLSNSTTGTTNITPTNGSGNSTWYGYGTDDTPATTFDQVYSYTGNVQTFTAPKNAVYKIETWGAGGGYYNATQPAGKGGYSYGEIYLNQSDNLYLYVGEMGKHANTNPNAGGWNGGGYSLTYSGTTYAGGGGGATDVRLNRASDTNTVWKEDTSLRSRIMVAGGGGGAGNYTGYNIFGGNGGNLGGGTGTSSSSTYATHQPSGGDQAIGGINPYLGENTRGQFGYAKNYNSSLGSSYGAGGGGGYYGGAEGHGSGGSGGSSYISGYEGAIAVSDEDSTSPKRDCNEGILDVTCSYHYSNKVFNNAVMIDGKSSMPTTNGLSIVGVTNNGAARITQLSNNIRTRTYSTVATAAQSTARTLYGIYQMSVNYQKGSNVTEIGDTSGSCLMNYDDSYCSVGTTSITPAYGYEENGWSTTQNNTHYGIVSSGGVTLNTNNQTYYGNSKTVGLDVTYNSGNYIDHIPDMNDWSYMMPAQFTVNYDNSTNMNTVTVTGVSGWEQIYIPFTVINGKKYHISFDYSIPNAYAPLSGYSGIGVQILNAAPTDSNNPSTIVTANHYLPTAATEDDTMDFEFTASTSGTYYFVFNFGMSADNATTTVNLGNFSISYDISVQHAHYGDNYQVPSSNPVRSDHTFIEWHDENGDLVDNNKAISVAEDHVVIAQWGKDPVITYSSGNILEGLDDCETTQGETGTTGVHYMEYSISDGEVTVTNIRGAADGFGYTTGRVYLRANHTYRFNAETDGTWSSTENSGQVEAYLMLNGLNVGIVCGSSNFCHMDSNENFEFTPLISGEYWLRLDVNVSGETYTFSNISVEEIIDEIAVPYNGNYVLPSSDPIWNDHQFSGWYCSDNTPVTSSTQLCENVDHTVFAHWNRTYHVYLQGIGGLPATRSYKFDGFYNKDNGHLDNTLVGNSIYVWDNMNQDSTTSNDARIMSGTWGDDYLQLNGTTGGVNVNHGYGNKASQSAFTIESIVTLEGYPGSGNESWIIGNIEGGGVGLGIDGAGRVKFQYWNGSAYQITYGPSLILGKKYHLIGTFNAGVGKIYVDGRLVVQQTMSGANIIHPATTNGVTNMWIGCNPGPSGCQGGYFNGKIYSVSYYASAITDNTISAAGLDLKQNDAYSSLPTPSRTGYTFGGWYDSTDFSNQITNSSVFNGNEDITLYAKWTASLNTTFYDNEYNVPISVTNGTASGVTYSWDSTKHYLTLNGTQNDSINLTYITTSVGYGDEWDIILRHVSGSYTKSGNAFFNFDALKGTAASPVGLSPRSYVDCDYPTSGSSTYTYAPTLLAAQDGTNIRIRMWIGSSGAIVFKNYVMQVDVVKRTTAYYSGTSWNDLSKHKNGVVNNGTFVAPSGNNDGYLQLNGTNTWANLGIVPNTNRFTLEADVMLDSNPPSGESYIVGNPEGGGYGLRISPNGNASVCIYFSAWQCVNDDATVLSTGVRYKLAATYDGTKIRLYVNGIEKVSAAATANIGAPLNSTVMAIGCNPGGSACAGVYFAGRVYSVKVSNVALSPSKLGTNYIDSTTVRYYTIDSAKSHIFSTKAEVSSNNYIVPDTVPTGIDDNIFSGWYTATTNGVSKGVNNKVNLNYDHALFAHYTYEPPIGNSVRVKYVLNGGEWAGSTDATLGVAGSGENKYVTFANGNRDYQPFEYNTTVNLADYNNPDYINISKVGYVGASGAQWCTQANGGGTCYNQDTNYETSDFCDASSSSCDVTLYVHWTRNFTCGTAGSTTSYADKTWYTIANDTTNNICELALNDVTATYGAYSGAVSALNAYITSSNDKYNDKLASEKKAGLITTWDSAAGTGRSTSASTYLAGSYWVASGRVFHSAAWASGVSLGSNVYYAGGRVDAAHNDYVWYNSAWGAKYTINGTCSQTGVSSANSISNVTATNSSFTHHACKSSTTTTQLHSEYRSFAPDHGTSSGIWLKRANNGTYNNTMYASNRFDFVLCGREYHNKSVILTRRTTASYHYWHKGMNTSTTYAYSATARRFQFAGGSPNNSGNSTNVTLNFTSSGCSTRTQYSDSTSAKNIYYRLHIKVKTN